MVTQWQDLIASTGTAEDGTALGVLIEVGDSSLASIQLAPDGSIKSWPQIYVSAPGETPSFETPLGYVNWGAFADALAKATEDMEDLKP